MQRSLIRLTALLGSACLSIAVADVLTLRDGRTVRGTFLGGNARQVRVAVGEAVQNFSIDEIVFIEFGNGGRAMLAPAQPATPATPAAPAPPAPPEPPAVAARPARPGTEIPTGTAIVIRMIDDVDSQRDQVGQTFKASVDEPVLLNGETLIPRGADVVAKLVDDKDSGKLTGRTELTLDIVSVQLNGRLVDVDTATVTQASESRTGRSATVVGGTAAIGAIIGAIAGGGKGAAIGAVSGAGAGAAVQVLTKGQRVRIPSETRLTFSLQQPVRL